jgi:hypothetical protein
MDTLSFVMTLLLAALGPVVALAYLKPILLRVLRSQCPDGGDGAEFWIRSAHVLAVTGTLLLALSFGNYEAELMPALERALWLVMAGTFGTVAFIARQVWAPVRRAQRRQSLIEEQQLAQLLHKRQVAGPAGSDQAV